MSYTPTNWQTGDTITAEKLNNMEQGIKNANEPFLVTLTPTAQDFSGTMDKTVAEINAAYEAGRKIIFHLVISATSAIDAECFTHATDSDCVYPSYNAYIVTDNPLNAVFYVYTGLTDDGTRNVYSIITYPLTPMS